MTDGNKRENPRATETAMARCLALKDQGNQHLSEGNFAEAEACYREALEWVPDYAAGYVNLGYALLEQGLDAEAEILLHRGLAFDPTLEDALFLLARVAAAKGEPAAAAGHLEQAVALRPEFPEAIELLQTLYAGLANDHAARGEESKAEACLRRAVALTPRQPGGHIALGFFLMDRRRLAEARTAADDAITADPDSADAHCLLGLIELARGNPDAATDSLERAVALRPDFMAALERLATLYWEQGFVREAIECNRRQLAIDPNLNGAYSNFLTTSQYDPDLRPEDLFARYLGYAAQFEAPWKSGWRSHPNRRDPERRLRIGYLSPDFRAHSVAFFILPFLQEHDRNSFEIVCYHDQRWEDHVTAEIRSLSDRFVPCAGWTDEELERRIKSDEIDILVDLTGHFGNNRLPLFARKPAPIQVTWIGSPATTGLSAMDYRFTDGYMDPPGLTERYHTETLVRLPFGASFRPARESPEVNALPALENGFLTLASLNHQGKVNDRVIGLWSRIMAELPGARMLLGNVNSNRTRLRLLSAFGAYGIGPDRLDFRPRLPLRDYLALHGRIDLALDTFPYSGGTTSLHSLWMGVPVLTLSGANSPSRQSISALELAGLPDFVTETENDYRQKVLQWADQLQDLNRIRQELRPRLTADLFGDRTMAIVEAVERTYREIWQAWLKKAREQGSPRAGRN